MCIAAAAAAAACPEPSPSSKSCRCCSSSSVFVFSSPSPPTIVEEFLPSSDIAPADDQGTSRDIQESLAHETTENRRRRKPTCLKTAGSWEAPSNRAPWPLQIRNWVLSTLVLCCCCSCSSPLYVSLSLSLSLCLFCRWVAWVRDGKQRSNGRMSRY